MPEEQTMAVPRRRLGSSALYCAALLVVSACGTGAGAAADREGRADRSGEPDEALLEFAGCMRDQGVDMPDPGPEGIAGMSRHIDQRSPADLAALEACGEVLQRVYQETHGDDHDDVERREEMQLERVQCMRDQGIDVPDPGPGQHRFPLDTTDPAVRAALEECFGDIGHGPGH